MEPAEQQEEDYLKLDNTSAHHDAAMHEEGEGPWLMSFADMVTLLMCFFILFFQTDQGNIRLQDPEKLLERLENLQKFIGRESIDDYKVVETPNIRTPSGGFGSMDNFRRQMRQMSKDLDLVFSIGTPQPGEVELTFLNTRFFRSGRADLTPRAKQMLMAVATKIRTMSKEAQIEVEGHTDSDPIKSIVYPSNWELSGSRAATVVKLLATQGIAPKRMRASGLAHYQPIVPEKDKQGRSIASNKSLNRRIVIRITHPLPQPKNPGKQPRRGKRKGKSG